MEKRKKLSLINCIGSGLLVYILTVPMHEFFHFLTFIIYGDKVSYFSGGAVDSFKLVDYGSLSAFHRVMLAGGSASILNFIIAIILLFVLIKVKKMGSMLRLILIQLFGAQMATAVGYFFFGGIINMGDWGNVFSHLEDMPGVITPIRITLIVLGTVGIVFTFFVLNYFSYDFIHDPSDKKERFSVSAKMYLSMFIMGLTLPMLVMIKSPALADGSFSLLDVALWNMAWIVFFWGFMFTWVMVRPPKESRFKNELPNKPNIILLIISVILVLLDIFILGPGIYFEM